MCELEWLLSMHYYNLYSVCHVLKRYPVINNFAFYLSGVLDKFPSFFFTCPYMTHSTLKNKWSTLFIKVINSWDYCADRLLLTPWYINSWDYCTDRLPLGILLYRSTVTWYIHSWYYCTDRLPLDIFTACFSDKMFSAELINLHTIAPGFLLVSCFLKS